VYSYTHKKVLFFLITVLYHEASNQLAVIYHVTVIRTKRRKTCNMLHLWQQMYLYGSFFNITQHDDTIYILPNIYVLITGIEALKTFTIHWHIFQNRHSYLLLPFN